MSRASRISANASFRCWLPSTFLPHCLPGWFRICFPDQVFPEPFKALVRYGLVIPAVAIFFVRTEKTQSASAYSVDLFYSLLLFLMVVVLVLGAFAIKQVSHGNYVISLAQALIVAAGLLVALSLLWDPRAGFAGIGQLVTRYFLSIGVPFERWMHSLAALGGPRARSGQIRHCGGA